MCSWSAGPRRTRRPRLRRPTRQRRRTGLALWTWTSSTPLTMSERAVPGTTMTMRRRRSQAKEAARGRGGRMATAARPPLPLARRWPRQRGQAPLSNHHPLKLGRQPPLQLGGQRAQAQAGPVPPTAAAAAARRAATRLHAALRTSSLPLRPRQGRPRRRGPQQGVGCHRWRPQTPVTEARVWTRTCCRGFRWRRRQMTADPSR
mmetsp:Transcript_20545/g.65820  ORF Transcript_20545/g.65820 Transcript_20545/m.65820 type:complete len:204 (+) Transcript_20545:1005-1616(+)